MLDLTLTENDSREIAHPFFRVYKGEENLKLIIVEED